MSMRLKNRFRPRVEQLEDRWVPATVTLINGDAFVSAIHGNLTVTMQSPTTMLIADSTTSVLVSAPNLLEVTGDTVTRTYTIDANGKDYSGNIILNTVGGSSTITVEDKVGGGEFAGTLLVSAGVGSHTTNINSVAGGTLTFGGAVTLVESGGINTLNVGNATGKTIFDSSLSATGFNNVTLSKGAAASTTIVKGTLQINSANVTGDLVVNDGGGLQYLQGLSITGSRGNDSVTLATKDAVATSFGNVNINLQLSASDSVTLGAAIAANQTINGNLTFTAGSGNSTITINKNIVLGGDTTLNMGSGNNTYNLANAFTANGNFTINSTGSGSNTIVLGGTFGGELITNLGGGTEKMSFTATAIVGAGLSFTAGNGANDTLDLSMLGTTNPESGPVVFRVGSGDGDTFTVGTTGVIDGSVNITLGSGGAVTQDLVNFGVGSQLNGQLTLNAGNGTYLVNLEGNSTNTLTPTPYTVALTFGTGTNKLNLGSAADTFGTIFAQPGSTSTYASLDNSAFTPFLTISNFVANVPLNTALT